METVLADLAINTTEEKQRRRNFQQIESSMEFYLQLKISLLGQTISGRVRRVDDGDSFLKEVLHQHRQQHPTAKLGADSVVAIINVTKLRTIKLKCKVWDQCNGGDKIWFVTTKDWQDYDSKVLAFENPKIRHGKRIPIRSPTALSQTQLITFIEYFHPAPNPQDNLDRSSEKTMKLSLTKNASSTQSAAITTKPQLTSVDRENQRIDHNLSGTDNLSSPSVFLQKEDNLVVNVEDADNREVDLFISDSEGGVYTDEESYPNQEGLALQALHQLEVPTESPLFVENKESRGEQVMNVFVPELEASSILNESSPDAIPPFAEELDSSQSNADQLNNNTKVEEDHQSIIEETADIVLEHDVTEPASLSPAPLNPDVQETLSEPDYENLTGNLKDNVSEAVSNMDTEKIDIDIANSSKTPLATATLQTSSISDVVSSQFQNQDDSRPNAEIERDIDLAKQEGFSSSNLLLLPVIQSENIDTEVVDSSQLPYLTKVKVDEMNSIAEECEPIGIPAKSTSRASNNNELEIITEKTAVQLDGSISAVQTGTEYCVEECEDAHQAEQLAAKVESEEDTLTEDNEAGEFLEEHKVESVEKEDPKNGHSNENERKGFELLVELLSEREKCNFQQFINEEAAKRNDYQSAIADSIVAENRLPGRLEDEKSKDIVEENTNKIPTEEAKYNSEYYSFENELVRDAESSLVDATDNRGIAENDESEERADSGEHPSSQPASLKSVKSESHLPQLNEVFDSNSLSRGIFHIEPMATESAMEGSESSAAQEIAFNSTKNPANMSSPPDDFHSAEKTNYTESNELPGFNESDMSAALTTLKRHDKTGKIPSVSAKHNSSPIKAKPLQEPLNSPASYLEEDISPTEIQLQMNSEDADEKCNLEQTSEKVPIDLDIFHNPLVIDEAQLPEQDEGSLSSLSGTVAEEIGVDGGGRGGVIERIMSGEEIDEMITSINRRLDAMHAESDDLIRPKSKNSSVNGEIQTVLSDSKETQDVRKRLLEQEEELRLAAQARAALETRLEETRYLLQVFAGLKHRKTSPDKEATGEHGISSTRSLAGESIGSLSYSQSKYSGDIDDIEESLNDRSVENIQRTTELSSPLKHKFHKFLDQYKSAKGRKTKQQEHDRRLMALEKPFSYKHKMDTSTDGSYESGGWSSAQSVSSGKKPYTSYKFKNSPILKPKQSQNSIMAAQKLDIPTSKGRSGTIDTSDFYISGSTSARSDYCLTEKGKNLITPSTSLNNAEIFSSPDAQEKSSSIESMTGNPLSPPQTTKKKTPVVALELPDLEEDEEESIIDNNFYLDERTRDAEYPENNSISHSALASKISLPKGSLEYSVDEFEFSIIISTEDQRKEKQVEGENQVKLSHKGHPSQLSKVLVEAEDLSPSVRQQATTNPSNKDNGTEELELLVGDESTNSLVADTNKHETNLEAASLHKDFSLNKSSAAATKSRDRMSPQSTRHFRTDNNQGSSDILEINSNKPHIKRKSLVKSLSRLQMLGSPRTNNTVHPLDFDMSGDAEDIIVEAATKTAEQSTMTPVHDSEKVMIENTIKYGNNDITPHRKQLIITADTPASIKKDRRSPIPSPALLVMQGGHNGLSKGNVSYASIDSEDGQSFLSFTSKDLNIRDMTRKASVSDVDRRLSAINFLKPSIDNEASDTDYSTDDLTKKNVLTRDLPPEVRPASAGISEPLRGKNLRISLSSSWMSTVSADTANNANASMTGLTSNSSIAAFFPVMPEERLPSSVSMVPFQVATATPSSQGIGPESYTGKCDTKMFFNELAADGLIAINESTTSKNGIFSEGDSVNSIDRASAEMSSIGSESVAVVAWEKDRERINDKNEPKVKPLSDIHPINAALQLNCSSSIGGTSSLSLRSSHQIDLTGSQAVMLPLFTYYKAFLEASRKRPKDGSHFDNPLNSSRASSTDSAQELISPSIRPSAKYSNAHISSPSGASHIGGIDRKFDQHTELVFWTIFQLYGTGDGVVIKIIK